MQNRNKKTGSTGLISRLLNLVSCYTCLQIYQKDEISALLETSSLFDTTLFHDPLLDFSLTPTHETMEDKTTSFSNTKT